MDSTNSLKRSIILSNITTTHKALSMINCITQLQLNKDSDTNNDEALQCIEDIAKYTLETQKI